MKINGTDIFDIHLPLSAALVYYIGQQLESITTRHSIVLPWTRYTIEINQVKASCQPPRAKMNHILQKIVAPIYHQTQLQRRYVLEG